MADATCAHQHCSCPIEAGKSYCSTYCELNNQTVPCGCGHETCTHEAQDDGGAQHGEQRAAWQGGVPSVEVGTRTRS